ncbi:hypothetical protein MMC25_002409 [Agyrium rufum]|nr:hypothetical protein [Agyrium rufum]
MSTEGLASFDFPSAGKPLMTWYRVYGEYGLSNGRRPLIILHGGPGVPCDYLSLLAEPLWLEYSIPTIIYDQVGCGRSTHLKEKADDPGFWTHKGVTYMFQEQLLQLKAHLGLKGEYDLLGFSAGGCLAFDYHVNHQDDGIQHLILASSPYDYSKWREVVKEQLRELKVLEIVEKHEAAATLEDPEYQAACEAWSGRHMSVLPEAQWPEELKRSLQMAGEDPTVSTILGGSDEFLKNTGLYSTWSAVGRMDQVKVPTLITNGVFDMIPSKCQKAYVDGIKDTEWVVFEKSAHLFHIEEPDKCVEVLNNFLRR